MKESCVADREPSKPFYGSTSSTAKTQKGREHRTPFLLTTQPRPEQKHVGQSGLAVKETCI